MTSFVIFTMIAHGMGDMVTMTQYYCLVEVNEDKQRYIDCDMMSFKFQLDSFKWYKVQTSLRANDRIVRILE